MPLITRRYADAAIYYTSRASVYFAMMLRAYALSADTSTPRYAARAMRTCRAAVMRAFRCVTMFSAAPCRHFCVEMPCAMMRATRLPRDR